MGYGVGGRSHDRDGLITIANQRGDVGRADKDLGLGGRRGGQGGGDFEQGHRDAGERTTKGDVVNAGLGGGDGGGGGCSCCSLESKKERKNDPSSGQKKKSQP